MKLIIQEKKMELWIEELEKCLDEEIETFKGMLSLITGEKDLLVANREEELEMLLIKLTGMVDRAQTLEKERVRLTRKIGFSDKKTTWFKSREQMAEYIGSENASRFYEKIKKIKSLILKISEVNNNNVFLINQGRKNIKAFFDLILHQYDTRTYSNNGKIGSGYHKNILLDKRF
jgi:flagellar biosynthesis/type III secretory pathway chaperone